ncbi:hypothetical protein BDK92_7261 [Micromonospora pisi]|uniref:Glycosyl transferase family 2 n=1 Tax=Micromonospora pisi TaxID=589240 RepID=A0A495JVC2_9ACTN|nr:hypothetical protein [Micromonospora pisi]RKR92781.1 hypothetical protein BDK92_7261 [Micromonospora pisi]
MTVTVLVPWRPDGGHRDRAWAWVRRWWAATHPDWQVVAGTNVGGPWVKANAVGYALTRADGDMLVIADADVICHGVDLAVDAVERGAPWAVPHGNVHRLTELATTAVFSGVKPASVAGATTQDPYRGLDGGGITVLPRIVYEQVPLDPRFQGWGGEDESWALALTSLAGPSWRGTAPLYHLWHPPQERLNRHVGSAPSRALQVRYQYAAKHGPAAVRALLDETPLPAPAGM